jgi:hypothetical protein
VRRSTARRATLRTATRTCRSRPLGDGRDTRPRLGDLDGEFLSQLSNQRGGGSLARFDVATREVPDVRIPPQRRAPVAQQHVAVLDEESGNDLVCFGFHVASLTSRDARTPPQIRDTPLASTRRIVEDVGRASP